MTISTLLRIDWVYLLIIHICIFLQCQEVVITADDEEVCGNGYNNHDIRENTQ